MWIFQSEKVVAETQVLINSMIDAHNADYHDCLWGFAYNSSSLTEYSVQHSSLTVGVCSVELLLQALANFVRPAQRYM